MNTATVSHRPGSLKQAAGGVNALTEEEEFDAYNSCANAAVAAGHSPAESRRRANVFINLLKSNSEHIKIVRASVKQGAQWTEAQR